MRIAPNKKLHAAQCHFASDALLILIYTRKNELFVAIHGSEVSGRPLVEVGKIGEKLDATRTALDRALLAASIYRSFTRHD